MRNAVKQRWCRALLMVGLLLTQSTVGALHFHAPTEAHSGADSRAGASALEAAAAGLSGAVSNCLGHHHAVSCRVGGHGHHHGNSHRHYGASHRHHGTSHRHHGHPHRHQAGPADRVAAQAGLDSVATLADTSHRGADTVTCVGDADEASCPGAHSHCTGCQLAGQAVEYPGLIVQPRLMEPTWEVVAWSSQGARELLAGHWQGRAPPIL